MSGRNDPSALRWLIGVELSAYRKQAGLTLSELATATGITKPKLGHMESGRYQQHPDDIATVLCACGADERTVDRLASLSGRGDSKSWWAPWAHVVPDWFRTFVGLEGLAESEFMYEPTVLPGLLQTEEYARAMTSATALVRQNHNERFVSFRLARARRLLEPESLRLHVVVGEAALRLKVGSDELRKVQYQHLLDLVTRPNITFQVLQPECGPHDAAGAGQFFVLHFAEARPIAYTELLDGAVYVQDPDDVRTYTLTAENLQRVALDPAESVDFVKALMSET
ncbi:helix-turn-helix transcriptional regulator [Saccharopolyspora shandongensis]|uniref:helix-turn-helix domain-containing protein n=1 Tax=Saccharopolyspora shandongensis TaxID=418495 RepID=UPI0033D8161F